MKKNYLASSVCNGKLFTRPELTAHIVLLVHLIVVMRPWLQMRCEVDFLVINHILEEKYYLETFHAIAVQK